MNQTDEISLRDLYLILRRGLPWIVGVALAAGAIALVIGLLLPTTFRSLAVTQVIPTSVETPQLDFNPLTNLSFEAYESIALSAPVLEGTLAALGRDGGEVDALRERLSVRRLAGPSNPSQLAPLTVEHGTRGDVPDDVVRLASAWTDATLMQVRSALSNSLGDIVKTTAQALDQRKLILDEAERAWQMFQANDVRDIAQLRLNDTNSRIASGRARLDELQRLIAITSARQRFLAGQLDAATPGGAVGSDTQINALVDAELISAETANSLRALLAERSADADPLQQDLLRLLVRSDLQRQTGHLVEHLAERDVLLAERDRLEQQAEELRSQIADLSREARALERTLSEASNAYDNVAEVVSAIDYAAEIAGTSAILLSPPTSAPRTVGPGALTIAVITSVLAGLAAILAVFIREAVRDPSAATSSGS